MRWLAVLLVVVTSASARAETGEKWDGATMGLQSAAGLGGFAIGGGLVYLATSNDKCEGWDCYDFSPVLLAGVVAIGSGVAATKLTGDALDGTGSTLGTLAGSGLGLLGGIGGAMLTAKVAPNAPLAANFASFVLPIIAGGVIGYHFSADDNTATMRMPLLGGAF
jgi:hypothetical protein